MTTTILKEVAAFLFGRRYYAFVYRYAGTEQYFIGSKIFTTRGAVLRQKREMEGSSLVVARIVTFRSRDFYPKSEYVVEA